MLVLQCSPRPQGATDLLCDAFSQGARAAGASINILALRDHKIAPCHACDACVPPPHICGLATASDGAETIFLAMKQASLIFLASPIYFYGLPASFKALIDRGQKFWHASQNAPRPQAPKPVIVFLTAGRTRGKLLFSGALRTLSCFFKFLDCRIISPHLLRGIDGPQSLGEKDLQAAWERGRNAARIILSAQKKA